jgi:oligopeptide transport system permease protein
MTVYEQQNPSPVAVATLKERPKGESLWGDAWRRLRRNKAALLGAVIILLNILMAVFAPMIAPKDPAEQILTDNNAVSSWMLNVFPRIKAKGTEGGYATINDTYLFGADNLGRDLLSRIIYGSRVSLFVAFIGPLFSISIGLTVGLISGYAGGRTDNLIMRFVDMMYAFPTFLLIVLLMAFFRTSMFNLKPGSWAYTLGQLDKASGGMLFITVGIAITSWMQTARLTRGQVLSVREKEYIEAARSIGTPTRQIMLSHVLPNILGPLIIAETLTIPTYISYEAFLSFIGLGVNPPTPSWGGMISDGARVIATYPNQALFPALALFFIMFAFNFLGDGLRDALDPRMRGVD